MTVGVKVDVCVCLVYVSERDGAGRCDCMCVSRYCKGKCDFVCFGGQQESREGQDHSRTQQRSQTQADPRKDTPNTHMPHSQSWGNRLAFGFIFMLLCLLSFCYATFQNIQYITWTRSLFPDYNAELQSNIIKNLRHKQ